MNEILAFLNSPVGIAIAVGVLGYFAPKLGINVPWGPKPVDPANPNPPAPVPGDGEVLVKSPGQMVGYYKRPDLNAAAFTEDGYFKTGDLGYVREDGSFVYQSRMGDTMRIGGFLVDPSEIEHVLAEQPEIQSAQVVGIEIEGKLRPVAFVIKATSEEPSVPSILNNVAAQLAKFKVPARLWFVDEFPATASANGLKFQRVKLREMAVNRLSAER